jgi:hypothetical protein
LQQAPLAGALHRKAQVRPARAGRRQHRGELFAHAILAHADANQLRRRIGAGDLHDVIVDRQHAAGGIDDMPAHRRERDAGRALVEQLDAEQRLQAPDLRADRRLGHALGPGGARKTALLDDQDKRAQEIGRNIRHARSLLKNPMPPPACGLSPANRRGRPQADSLTFSAAVRPEIQAIAGGTLVVIICSPRR